MLLSINSSLYDIFGHILLNINPISSRLNTISRRVSRTATLDGGALIVDNGYSPADATLNIVPAMLTKTDRDILRRLATQHSSLILCTHDGAFSGVISNITENREMIIYFLVQSQLSNSL